MTKLLMAGVVAALCAVIGTPAAIAQTITGCLTNGGKLKSIALGGAPLSPCTGADVQVTLGEIGPAGADGNAAQFELITFGEPTNGSISEDEWDECAKTVGGRPANSFDALTLPWAASSTDLVGWVNPYIVAHATGDEVVDISGIVGDGSTLACRLSDISSPWSTDVSAARGLVAIRGSVSPAQCNFMGRITCVQAVGP